MLAPTPIRMTDFFGNLSVSSSPYGWSAWFIYFASLIYVGDQKSFEIMLPVSYVSLAFLLWKSSLDKVDGDNKQFLSELRFIAGSGIGATVLALAGAVGNLPAAVDKSHAMIVLLMACMMLLLFSIIVILKKLTRLHVHNFTQSYLLIGACYAGVATHLVYRGGGCRSSSSMCGSIDLFYMFAVGWIIAFVVFFYKFFKLPRWIDADTD